MSRENPFLPFGPALLGGLPSIGDAIWKRIDTAETACTLRHDQEGMQIASFDATLQTIFERKGCECWRNRQIELLWNFA